MKCRNVLSPVGVLCKLRTVLPRSGCPGVCRPLTRGSTRPDQMMTAHRWRLMVALLCNRGRPDGGRKTGVAEVCFPTVRRPSARVCRRVFASRRASVDIELGTDLTTRINRTKIVGGRRKSGSASRKWQNATTG